MQFSEAGAYYAPAQVGWLFLDVRWIRVNGALWYFLLFYRSKGLKKNEIWKYISFCHLNPNGSDVSWDVVKWSDLF